MRPRGRRSPRNLPCALNQGSVVTAPADGDCFFWIVAKAKNVTVAELRSLVADNYDEATFQLVCAAGQAPSGLGCNDYEAFINGISRKEYADEKCMEIIAKSLSVAFLICDDNIGGVPAAFPPLRSWDAVFAPTLAPDHLVTMRLGREHYSGIEFNGKMLHRTDDGTLHDQIRNFWRAFIPESASVPDHESEPGSHSAFLYI